MKIKRTEKNKNTIECSEIELKELYNCVEHTIGEYERYNLPANEGKYERMKEIRDHLYDVINT